MSCGPAVSFTLTELVYTMICNVCILLYTCCSLTLHKTVVTIFFPLFDVFPVMRLLLASGQNNDHYVHFTLHTPLSIINGLDGAVAVRPRCSVCIVHSYARVLLVLPVKPFRFQSISPCGHVFTSRTSISQRNDVDVGV